MARARSIVGLSLVCSGLVCAGAALAQGSAPAPGAPAQSAPAQSIPFPHPVISEVLAFVPNTNDVDPSRDNLRDPVGDEFIELVNPHDRPIDLTGYIIADALAVGRPEDERGLRFVFPRFVLGPGECVVVFNGHRTAILGPHGDPNTPPERRNEKFENAWVFTMNNASRLRALHNSDELVVVLSPRGEPIDALAWGEPSAPAPEGCLRAVSTKRSLSGSLVRTSADGEIVSHARIRSAAYSPGRPFAGPEAAGAATE